MLNHNPGIFIGLGGAGVNSLARLKAKMYVLYKDSDALAKFDEHSFIFIDTDANDIDRINQSDDLLTRMDGYKPIAINKDEFIDLGRTVPYKVREHMKNFSSQNGASEHFFSWMISNEDNPNYRSIQHSLTSGAGCSRLDGRTAFFDNYNEIKEAIERSLVKFSNYAEYSDDSDNSTFKRLTNFWVISGSNGGTGSAILLDILFLFERLFSIRHNARPYIHLALVMPEAYCRLSGNINNTRLNSFATLWELNAFKTGKPRFTIPASQIGTNHYNYFFATPDFKGASLDGYNQAWDVFDYCLVFDSASKDGMLSLELNDVFENASNSILELSCTPIGARVNSIIIKYTYQWELSDFKVISKQPKIIEGQKWGRFAVATGNQSIKKPINEFKSYLQTRFKLEMLQYGLIGESFANVHRNNKEAQENAIGDICKEWLFKDIFPNEGIISNEKNLFTIIESEFRKITHPQDIQLKEKKFLGISRGYEDGQFYEIFSIVKCELQQKSHEIIQLFEEKKKNEILDSIKENLNDCLHKLVLSYGYQYACDVLIKLDIDLESADGSTYLSEFNLSALYNELNANFSDAKGSYIEAAIEDCCSQNNDLNAFIASVEAYISFYKSRLLNQLKLELVKSLVDGRNGILDHALHSPSGEYGLLTLLEKLKKELSITEFDFKKLAVYFERNESKPLTVFLPPLHEMVKNAEWVEGSVFANLYESISQRGSNEQIPEANRTPMRNGPNSLEDVLNHFSQWTSEKGDTNNKQEYYFADLALKEGVSFSQFLKNIFGPEESYFEKTIIQHPEIMHWINGSLENEYYRFIDKNTNENIQSLKHQFARDLVFYPTNTNNQNIEKLTVFSGGRNLKRLAVDMGYNPNNHQHLFYETSSQDCLNKMVFEVGHTLGEYAYLQDYANFYEHERHRITNFEISCHSHKRFNTLDLDLALKHVIPDFIPLGSKIYATELLYYSALFSLMREIDLALYHQFFNENSNDYLLPGSSDEITPIMWAAHDPQTFFFRGLNIDEETGKLIFEELNSFTTENTKNFADLLINSLVKNKLFKKQIDIVSNFFKKNKDVHDLQKIHLFIQSNHADIVLKCTELVKFKQWKSEMNEEELSFVTYQFDQLLTENIFKL